MAPPLKSHLANERTFIEWVGMAIVLGTVAAALIGVEGEAAQAMGFCLAPSPIIFLLLALWQYQKRKTLLLTNDQQNPEMTSTTIALILGSVLFCTQCVVLLFDLQGTLVHV